MSDTPSKTQFPSGTETCGCCDGIAASTPTGIFNRAGLSAISYRIGNYAQFRESLQAGLASSAFPEPAPPRTRDADDFTLGLIDAVSCAADVLTFYQERVANESYLRTATERVSLQEMAKLTGYRLRPGVAAETRVAFALEVPKVPPARLPPEPGAFVTGIPTSLTLASGLKVQSVPGPDEKPQTFETVEEIDARPEWNAMLAVTSVDHVPGFGSQEMWIQGTDSQLKPGDMLLLVGPEFAADSPSNRWDVRALNAVEPDADNNRTRLAWLEPLDSVTPLVLPDIPPRLYAMRQRAAIFGHNAPDWRAMNDEFKAAYLGYASTSQLTDADRQEWPSFDIFVTVGSGPLVALGEVRRSIVVGGLARAVSLDRSYPQILAQGFAVLAKPDYRELYRITAVAEASRGEYAISGKSTFLTLAGQNLDLFAHAVRETTVFAQSALLLRSLAPLTSPAAGATIDVVGDMSDMPVGRALLIKGLRDDTGEATVHAATLESAVLSGANTVLNIAPPLPQALRRDTVVVFGNVALATHGETVSQILGAGDASKTFQRFELKRMPLTYRSATNETGADSELTVRVGDIAWTEKTTLFGGTATERAYTLVTDEQAKTWVVFGDGVRGARLPSGVNNVRANYRQGLGKDGNVDADKLTQLLTRPLGLKSVSNPVPAQGGTDPEPADQARRTMPLGTRTLDRAVSLLDYEDFALAFTGIAKAQASVLQLTGGPTIAITIAGQDGAVLSESNPVWNNLLLALKNSGDPFVRVALLPYQPSTFLLGLKVKHDPAYELKPLLAAVEAALRAHFAFDARSLGQPVLQSDVIAAAHTVPGVVAIDLDFLYGGTSPHAQTLPSLQTRLLASRMHASGGIAFPAELLTLDSAPFVRLEEMT